MLHEWKPNAVKIIINNPTSSSISLFIITLSYINII